MSLKDRTTDELLKQKKRSKFRVWTYSAFFLVTLLLYEIEQLSKTSWLVISLGFILISGIFSMNHYRINKELKRRESEPESD